jgi:hypothetical protein
MKGLFIFAMGFAVTVAPVIAAADSPATGV